MSNARFANKGLVKPLDLASLNALITFYEKGGIITKASPARRPKNGVNKGKSIRVGDK